MCLPKCYRKTNLRLCEKSNRKDIALPWWETASTTHQRWRPQMLALQLVPARYKPLLAPFHSPMEWTFETFSLTPFRFFFFVLWLSGHCNRSCLAGSDEERFAGCCDCHRIVS